MDKDYKELIKEDEEDLIKDDNEELIKDGDEESVKEIFRYLFTLPRNDGENIIVEYTYYIFAWIIFIAFIVSSIWLVIFLFKIIFCLFVLAAYMQGKAVDLIGGKNK